MQIQQYSIISLQINMTQDLKPFEYTYTENTSSKTLLIFIQGWPDTSEIWDYLSTEIYLNTYSILKINLPNHGTEKIAWGIDLEIIAARLKVTIDQIKNVQKRIMIAHDWGCYYTYMIDQRYQRYFTKIIALDVSPYPQLATLKEKLYVFSYQMYLLIAFLIGGWIGKKMTQLYAMFQKHHVNEPYFNAIDSSRNYPYFYFWKNMLGSIIDRRKRYLYKYVPSVPIIYMYGKQKIFQLQGPKWEKYVKEHEGCELHSLQTNHWIMKDYSKFIRQTIKRIAK